MGRHSIFITLVFSLFMFSSPSSAEWVLVQETKEAKSYVDADRMRDHKGYIFIWELLELDKPNEHGVSSIMAYTVNGVAA